MATLTRDQITTYAKNAGFKGDDLNTMVAIAYAESSGNPNTHNAKPPDDSYGLWQINMLGSMGPARRAQFGISSNDQLYDPATNARAAYKIYKSQGLNAWTTYTRGTYLKYMDGTTGFEDGKDTEGSQPLSGVEGAITSSVNSLGANLFKGVSNIAGIIVAVVLLVLGIILLARKPLMSVVPAGKAVKAIKAVS